MGSEMCIRDSAQLVGALLLDLEADDLLLGLLLPVGVFTEDLLLEGGYMVVEEVRDVVGLLEKRDGDPGAVVVQDDEGFGTFDGVEVEVPETFHALVFCLSEHYLNTKADRRPNKSQKA